MMQVSGQGEANPHDILGVISTAINDTKHKTLSTKHIYKKLKREEPEAMQKCRVRNCEDIRNLWTTFEKLDTWFLIKKGFGGGRVCRGKSH
mmetsp:Transcript_4460/g.8679  ORF Transcript_4460/g.8679 Transcript_4460/m.8679 type:complete len:91 (-) Transcript_4460:306-578(-)